MTKEDKELLLKDLCMRLPYDVMVDYESHIYILNEVDPACKDIDYITVRIQDAERLMCAESVMIESVKPYLRPMSSMTKEEKEELEDFGLAYWDSGKHTDEDGNTFIYGGREFQLLPDIETYDWLNAHHFDYRGLIEKGLAIAVTEDNNPYKE